MKGDLVLIGRGGLAVSTFMERHSTEDLIPARKDLMRRTVLGRKNLSRARSTWSYDTEAPDTGLIRRTWSYDPTDTVYGILRDLIES
jgi:hypothetical protein